MNLRTGITAFSTLALATLVACASGEKKEVAKKDSATAAVINKTGVAAGETAADTNRTGLAPDSSGQKAAMGVDTVPIPATGKVERMIALEVNHAKKKGLWPVKAPAPIAGAILPHKRIVAYYGNPLSRKMGVLGEYDQPEMFRRFDAELENWRKADPSTPVQPAFHLIAVVAQGAPGKDGKYRLRMDSTLIEKVYGWAKQKNALLFIDVQVGWATLQEELPRLEKFLMRPDVHLAIDPEFSMHYGSQGKVPGTKIGTFDAADVNYATQFLISLEQKYKTPPKILVVHRFTRKMVTNANQIKLDPRVQIVMDMDGWGPPWLKIDSYRDYIVDEPVWYTGFKLFYHNDIKKQGSRMLTAKEVLSLYPSPLYIQFQ